MDYLSLMNQKCTIVVPTFYPGEIILNLLKTIPSEYKILIVDNGEDDELTSIIKNCPLKIEHLKVGDVGLGRSFNVALSKIKTDYMFLTQPDVTLSVNCIAYLMETIQYYPKAAIVSPLFYDGKIYSPYDFYDLKISKNKKIIDNKKNKKKFNIIPAGDISVEAINSTALLIDVNKIKQIGGWDNNFYTYLEDIDLCLRLRQKNYEIIKTPSAIIKHSGFESHHEKNKEKMNISRNWNFCWSSIYFLKKHRSKFFFIKCFFFKIAKYQIKIIIYFLLNRKFKLKLYRVKLDACINFILGKSFKESRWKN
jgi:N-acetylglucosaminyl-diphospho-decaprenol L-rhamnosyltransferase